MEPESILRYRLKIAHICGIMFTFSFAYSVGSYSYGEYGHEAFWRIFRPRNHFYNHTLKSLCDKNTSSEEYRNEQSVQSMVSKWSTYMSLAQGIPLIVSSGLFCSLSDSMGRKPFVLVSLMGIFLKNLFMSVAVNLNWNIYSFLAFNFIDGCCGTWVIQLAMSMSMVSDLTTAAGKSRSLLITAVGFFISLGYASGSFASGFIVSRLGYSWSLGIASIVIAVPMCLLYFLVETLPENKKIHLDCNLITHLRNLVQFYIEDDPINPESSRWKYIVCLSVFICILLPKLGSFSVELYYVMDTPFCFNPMKIGIFQTVNKLVSEFLILFGIKIMQYKLDDAAIALVGTVTSSISFVMIGSASSIGILFAGSAVGVLGMCAIPMIRAILSKMTPAHKQGTMYAGIAIVETICGCVGAVTGSSIYAATVDVYRGIVFYVFAVFLLLASVLLILLKIDSRRRRPGYDALPGTCSVNT